MDSWYDPGVKEGGRSLKGGGPREERGSL